VEVDVDSIGLQGGIVVGDVDNVGLQGAIVVVVDNVGLQSAIEGYPEIPLSYRRRRRYLYLPIIIPFLVIILDHIHYTVIFLTYFHESLDNIIVPSNILFHSLTSILATFTKQEHTCLSISLSSR
jgi:hypothetical protein